MQKNKKYLENLFLDVTGISLIILMSMLGVFSIILFGVLTLFLTIATSAIFEKTSNPDVIICVFLAVWLFTAYYFWVAVLSFTNVIHSISFSHKAKECDAIWQKGNLRK